MLLNKFQSRAIIQDDSFQWPELSKMALRDEGRVPHISLVFREMWDTTNVDG